MVIENGVYLGWPAALTFRGPFVMSGVRRLLEVGIALQCDWCTFMAQQRKVLCA